MMCTDPQTAAATLERRTRDLVSDLDATADLLGRMDPRLWSGCACA